MSQAETYLLNHKASGLKVGDSVRVTRVVANWAGGWQNVWAEEEMDQFVGRVVTITGDHGTHGFLLSGGDCQFPYFVLELVDSAE